MIEKTDSTSLLNELKELFELKGRFVKGKLVPTYNLKIVRSHKMAEVQRDDSGRARVGETDTPREATARKGHGSDHDLDLRSGFWHSRAVRFPHGFRHTRLIRNDIERCDGLVSEGDQPNKGA